MDYTAQPLLFKVRKAARYVRLYGISRTIVKVRGQFHMRRRFDTLPAARAPAPSQRVALIGCGNYAYSNIAYFLKRKYGAVIGACMDKDVDRAASLAADYSVPFFTHDADAVLNLPHVELVFIASNHASHAEYAISALRAGKHVYIEKPHVVTYEQLQRLTETMRTSGRKVFLGFNRPDSRFGKIMRERLAAEPGAAMYNWFVAGHAIDEDHWYFHPQEGGRVLGNLCHWTDFLLRLPYDRVFPVTIVPVRAKRSDCDISVNYIFADESIGVITFSAKGHTFEGVSERFNGHRGNCLMHMDDFKELTVHIVDDKQRYVNRCRDHGHKDNIYRAYEAVFNGGPYDAGAAFSHIANTAWFFLKTKEALESSRTLVVRAYGEQAEPELKSVDRAEAHA